MNVVTVSASASACAASSSFFASSSRPQGWIENQRVLIYQIQLENDIVSVALEMSELVRKLREGWQFSKYIESV